MLCGNCKFSNIIENTDRHICTLTKREYTAESVCDIEYIRVRREREARIKEAGEKVSSDLERLLSKISKPTVNPNHLMSILTDMSMDAANKVTAAIEYLEDFV